MEKKTADMPRSLTNVVVLPGMIRAVRASHVKGQYGQLLASSCGSQETFELSIPTAEIDEFISHSWCRRADMQGTDPTYGRLKWLSLCLHQNSRAAVAASLVTGGVFATVEAAVGQHALPLVAHCWFDGSVRHVSFAPYVVGYLTFLVVLFFGFDFLPSPFLRKLSLRILPNRLMFLDKVCINQTDEQQNQAGIRAINEFIRRSKKLLVCEGGGEAPGRHYFQRLWCVFELAAFVSKEREAGREEVTDSIVMLPLFRPVCLLIIQGGIMLIHIHDYITILFAGGIFDCGNENSYSFSSNYFWTAVLTMIVPFWMDVNELVKKEELLRDLRSFRFQDVHCLEANDRESIRLAIEEFYERDGSGSGGVSATKQPQKPQPEAGVRERRRRSSSSSSSSSETKGKTGVDRFNEDVQRGRVYQAIEHAMGKQTGIFTRWQSAMAFLPNVFRAFSYFPANLEVQPNLLLFHGAILMILCPLLREGILYTYKTFMHLHLNTGPDQTRFTFLRRFSVSLVLSMLFSACTLMMSYPAVYILGLKSWSK